MDAINIKVTVDNTQAVEALKELEKAIEQVTKAVASMLFSSTMPKDEPASGERTINVSQLADRVSADIRSLNGY